MRGLLAWSRGFLVALGVPGILAGDGLPALLRSDPTYRSSRQTPGGVEPAVAAAHRSLSLLARLPRSPWRDTCLFRSIAECLVLRRYGVAAHVEIGVERAGDILAHAWVVRDLPPEVPSPDVVRGQRMHPLRFSPARS